jgi:hypothetical protein
MVSKRKIPIIIIAIVAAAAVCIAVWSPFAGTSADGARQQTARQDSATVTLSIDCGSILDRMDRLTNGKEGLVGDGVILEETEVNIEGGDTVFDVLARECKSRGIHMEYEDVPIYKSAYIEGINNIYEFDCGELSGWMYSVNGTFPNFGCSAYELKDGDSVEWRYTCDLGEDIGGRNVLS